MGGLGGGDDGRIGDKREMDTGVWDQVGLELVEIHIQGTVKAKGSGDRGDH